MKLIYFAPFYEWIKNGSPKKVGDADVLFIDPYRHRRENRETDNENYVTYRQEDLVGYRLGMSKRKYEDYLLLADKVLDRISDGEDVVLLNAGCIFEDDEVEFFRRLKKQKNFILHLMLIVFPGFTDNDYHQLLRLYDVNDICDSICFVNLRQCRDEKSSDSLLFLNEKVFDLISNAVRALPLRNTDCFCIYDHQKHEYVPYERVDYSGTSILEYKTSNGDICEEMYEYRKAFADKHGIEFKDNPCTKCESRQECKNVCGFCDRRSAELWKKVYHEHFDHELMSAKINGIDRFRIGTDGTGVRSLILMAGCPLNCAYCGNKRYKDIFPETSECEVSVMEYYLHKDGIYFEMTDGGVTFGGGEPLMQAEFIHEFHRKYPMWSVNIETSLNVPADKLRIIADDVDYWFVDIKDMNPDIYQRYTGKPNAQVRKNLAELLKLVPVEKICVRVPLIKGYNTSEDVERSAAELTQMGFTTIERFEYVVC